MNYPIMFAMSNEEETKRLDRQFEMAKKGIFITIITLLLCWGIGFFSVMIISILYIGMNL